MLWNGHGVHSPRYLLRRRIILHLLDRYPPGCFLEIGCGRGELMPWLAGRGFQGTGVEISREARNVALSTVRPHESRLRVVETLDTLEGLSFDYVMAFEVLEHLEDDAGALRAWRRWLKPDGRLIISVPARMRYWTAADELGGHYRRYERSDLTTLLQACGYSPEILWSYGFPITSVTRLLRNVWYRPKVMRARNRSHRERTLMSSFDSVRQFGSLEFLLSPLAELGGLLFHCCQLPFRQTDLGDGYLLSARLV